MAGSSATNTVTVGGRRLKLSNLNKVLYPRTGTTKRDVVEYFALVSGPLLAQLSGRPVTRKRWVDGVGTEDNPGKVFFRKDLEPEQRQQDDDCPDSLRGRLTPTVAAPRTWEELDDPDLAQLDHRDVVRRVDEGLDPMAVLAPDDLPTTARSGERAERDRLQVYRSMRDPDRTPEPVPASSATSGEGHSFVIQEHHARRLHWDFRLERDGVLVSWALPKGVPDDPRRNHLAVQTEDHPLEYGTFEGTIPKGEYGGGDVTIWDSGSYELEKWREGKEVIATLYGRPGGGLAEPVKVALIHTGSGGERNWLIHRMQLDREPTVVPQGDGPTGEPTGNYSPMLATLGTPSDIDDEQEWAFEMKWDGIRALARVGASGVELASRNGNDLTGQYPELAALQRAIDGGSAVLDGEIVALRDGRPDFGMLQRRMKLANPGEIEKVRRQTLGLEGVVAKTRAGRYQSGQRGRTWIKIKHHRTQEVIVIGWRAGQGRRSGQIGSLLLAVNDDDGLRYVGRVGTGLSEDDLDEIGTRLRRRARKTSPVPGLARADAREAHWVTPSEVAEVEFTEWTSDGRLRHPSWRGWRPDKDPHQVRRE